MKEEPLRELGERVAALGGLGRRLDDLQEHARRRAGRIRIGAPHAAQIAERVRELGRLRAELGEVVAELAAVAGIGAGRDGRPAVGTDPTRAAAGADPARAAAGAGTEHARAPAGGLYAGEVEIEVGPLRDFAQLTGFEDAAASIHSASEVELRNFARGRATFSMHFAQPVALVPELERRAPFPLTVRGARPDRLVLDIASGDEAQRTA